MLFTNKVVLITGAGDGMGRDTAILFAKKGAKIVINDLNPKNGNITLERVKSEGAEAIFVQGDVSDTADAERIVAEAVKAFGRIDILVNNAGIVPVGRVDNTSEKDFDKVMAVNVKGVFFMSKYSVLEMKKQGGGIIVHIASIAAIKGTKDRAAYAASKGAIIALTKSMAIDYIKENIRVNCICPGTTHTPSLEARIQATEDPEATRLDWVARQPLGRFGRGEEIAHAVLFAASDEVAFMDGTILSIDGGESI
jgi:NAD(P)-dependent dehydrogenase (short-subunit alcohol dehydrogenase family)